MLGILLLFPPQPSEHADVCSLLPSLWCVRWGNLKWLNTIRRNGAKMSWRLLMICDSCLHILNFFSAACTNWTCMSSNCTLRTQLLCVILYAVSFSIFSPSKIHTAWTLCVCFEQMSMQQFIFPKPWKHINCGVFYMLLRGLGGRWGVRKE